MDTARWNRRFLSTTRGRIMDLLRRQTCTVDELARALDLTDNAVRAHLTALERDGLVERRGLRRGPSKPSHAFGLTFDAELSFSRAYLPVLDELLATLLERDGVDAVDGLLRTVGRRLAAGRRATGTIEDRLADGAQTLNALGGLTETVIEGDTLQIHGHGCPLAAVTRHYPAACQVAASLLSEIVGVPMLAQCELGDRPCCRFVGTCPVGAGLHPAPDRPT